MSRNYNGLGPVGNTIVASLVGAAALVSCGTSNGVETVAQGAYGTAPASTEADNTALLNNMDAIVAGLAAGRAAVTTEVPTTGAATTAAGAAPTEAPATAAGGNTVLTPVVFDGSAVANAPLQSDESMRLSNSACGGELSSTSVDAFDYKFDFFSASADTQTLGKSYMDTLITDQRDGMGQAAFDILKTKAIVNGSTQKAAGSKTTGNTDLDSYIDRVFSIRLDQPTVYQNSDCREVKDTVTSPSKDIPLIRIGGGDTVKQSTVEGVVLTAADYAAWLQAASKDANGNIRFDVRKFVLTDASGNKTDAYFIVTADNGCDNQIRIPEVPGQPTNTTTPGSTAQTPPPTHGTGTTVPGSTVPSRTTVPGSTVPTGTTTTTSTTTTTTTEAPKEPGLPVGTATASPTTVEAPVRGTTGTVAATTTTKPRGGTTTPVNGTGAAPTSQGVATSTTDPSGY